MLRIDDELVEEEDDDILNEVLEDIEEDDIDFKGELGYVKLRYQLKKEAEEDERRQTSSSRKNDASRSMVEEDQE